MVVTAITVVISQHWFVALRTWVSDRVRGK
jgi:hypothetical protein